MPDLSVTEEECKDVVGIGALGIGLKDKHTMIIDDPEKPAGCQIEGPYDDTTSSNKKQRVFYNRNDGQKRTEVTTVGKPLSLLTSEECEAYATANYMDFNDYDVFTQVQVTMYFHLQKQSVRPMQRL